MARFSSTIYACIVVAAAMTAADSQGMRPASPARRTVPGTIQPVQNNQQTQQAAPPMNQQAQPGANPPQQPGQQPQAAQPIDPPPNTPPMPPTVTYRDGLLTVQA